MATGTASVAATPPLLPRTLLFDEPESDFAALSPDGRMLCLARRDSTGLANLWVQSLDRDTSWQVTHDARRGVQVGVWAHTGDHLLYLKDGDGDENDHVFAVDIHEGLIRDLTPFVGVRAENILLDRRVPDAMLVGLNVRSPHVFDLYRVDLETGALALEAENPGDVIEWTAGPGLRGRACTALRRGDVATVLRVRDRADGPWRDLVTWPFEQAGFDRYQKIVGFVNDSTLLVQMWAGGNTARLVTMSARDGRVISTVAHDPHADLWNLATGDLEQPVVLFSPDRSRILAVGFQYLKPEWRVLDPSVRADFNALTREAAGGSFLVADQDRAGRRWLVEFFGAGTPGRYALWDRDSKKFRPLFEVRPELRGKPLTTLDTLTVRARDGRPIPCYLALPPGVPPRNLPLVVIPHGGPWFRNHWAWDPEVQLLANRGYAVIEPQFRGSAGFGLDHLLAAKHEFGPGKVFTDLVDAADALVARGIVDGKRVGIMGGSFGGYSALGALAFAPGKFACAVDVVGPSDLATLFRTFPPYWGPRKQRWINWMGDVENDDALNRRLSPLYHAEKMRAPLLIAHGANDPRVKLAASEAIAKALRDRGVTVDFIVYPDEGHGFGRAENNLDFYGRVEEFLARHLGGRAEPWTAVAGATAERK